TSADGTTDQLNFDVYPKLEKIYEGMVTFSHSVELDDGRTERCEITAPLQFIFTFSGSNWPSTSSAKVKANRPSYGLNAEGLSATCTPRDNWQTNSMFVLSLDEDSLHIFINHIELDVEVTEDRIEGSGSFTGNDVFRFDGMSYPFTYVEAASFFVVAEQ
ncbi:MAG: hypothetical protein R3E66_05895, partial [bacterium]